MSPSFVHLHVHSEYSLSDSIVRIPDKPEYADPARAPEPNLLSRASELGMGALALCDDSNLFALIKFYRAAEAAGIKPIAGTDLWVADPGAEPFRVTVLCRDERGYRALCRLLSRAYRQRGHHQRVSVARDWLEGESEGLIALLGAHSDVGRLVLAGNDPGADGALARWQRHFDDCTYLELCRIGLAAEDAFLAPAVRLAARRGCPAIATNEVCFLERADFEAHETRVAIHAGWLLSDPKRPRRYSPEQYLKTPEAMAALFHDLPEAVSNTVELAQRCNLELKLGRYVLPAFPVPAQSSEEQHLRAEAERGLAARLEHPGPAADHELDAYHARLALELEVIVKMGFAGYFLVVADFIGWAKRNGIPVGPGRGSGAGSLVAYALDITDLDPLRFDLLFERFLNPERVSMPDFDVDFCMDRRDEVIDYVAARYGRERVAQIITYGTMAAKAVLRDTGRVLGMPYGQVDRIARMIPARPIDITLADALGVSEAAREQPERIAQEFKKAYEEEDDVRQLVDLARKLEGVTRNAGKHAGGVVIAPDALTDFVPLYSEEQGEGLVTQFDKDDVESIGLVKFDFLGLRTLTIIDWAVKAINRARAGRGESLLDMVTLPTDDAATYALLKTGRTTAVFQLESRGMQELIRKLLPDNFDDVVALVALFRPGPLQSGMVDDFVARKHGRAEVHYPHPLLEQILKPTYGVIVYQEQVMQIAQLLAGYTLGGADMLRRAMGKKKPEEMAKERVKFEAGAAANAVEAWRASSIFDLMEKFAEYGFNKSHSAAYALVAYQTAYLKAHFPSEFMAAVLSADMDKTEKVVHILADARAMGLTVLPPDVNEGEYAFAALPDGRIRYGLGAVKGVGRAAAEAIAEERTRGGPYADLADLTQRIDPNKLGKRVLEALTSAGALDALGLNRASVWQTLSEAMRAADQHVRDREAGQRGLFGNATDTRVPVTAARVPDWPMAQKLAGERDTLGHYLSGHPTDACRDWLAQLTGASIGKADTLYKPPPDGNEWRARGDSNAVVLAGVVAELRRRNDQMAFAVLEDWSGRIEVSFFREAMAQYGSLLSKDALLVVEGWLQLDEFSGGMALRVKRALTLEQACERAARVVTLRVRDAAPDLPRRLAAALSAHRPGQTPIRLVYCSAAGEAGVDLGESWRVRATPALVEALRGLAEVEAVELVLGRLPSAPEPQSRASQFRAMA